MIFFAILSGVFLVLIYYVKYLYTYWERKGFPTAKTSFPFGTLGPVAKIKTTMGELMRDIYLESTTPYIGIYYLFRPALLIRDPELVKRVLITDFDSFCDRGVHYDEKTDPVGASLFGMPLNKWKELRSRLSPTFTSGKLKNIFPAIQEKNDLLKHHLMKLTETSDTVQLKAILVQLNNSIIASAFFGFELNAFEEPDHEFCKIGSVYMNPLLLRGKIAMTLYFLCPHIMTLLKFPLLSPIVSKYVLNLVRTIVESRERDPSLVRQDFIQTAMEWMRSSKEDDQITLEMLAAQAFLFYLAAYETNVATASFCVYELSKNAEWMANAQNEVDALMKKRDGKILYEDLADLKVLDMCIKETMRMYPAAPLLNRECMAEYQIPGTNHVIPKGTPIVISNFGLQSDPKLYPNPEIYDPSRFDPENFHEDLPYYPLGGGPRACIGSRLGFLFIKRVLCTLLHNFDWKPIDSKLEFSPGLFFLCDKNNVRLKISKRSFN